MAKKEKMEEREEQVNISEMQIDDSYSLPRYEVPKNIKEEVKEVVDTKTSAKELINCLRNEKIIVRHLNKHNPLVRDPKHVLYGGLAENATRTYTVPLLRSGQLMDVLTDVEKTYLEYILGLEPNAMSVYKKQDNFWSTASDIGISSVTLGKRDTILDLSNPSDYIRYKILLANKDFVASSLQELEEHPKVTYEYVLISEVDSNKASKAKLSTAKACYKEFGKIEEDKDTLKAIIEIIDGRPISNRTKLEVLQAKIGDIIESNGKLFLKIVSDKYLPAKVLLRRAIEAGIIAKRGDFLYLRETNQPLCDNDQEPTLNIAAAYILQPKHQDLKFSIEAKLRDEQ